MARMYPRKRLPTDEPSQCDTEAVAKKTKTRSEVELEAWESWEYPPQFWDRLSKPNLSHRALRELDRRTCSRRSYPCHPVSPGRRFLSPIISPQDLARFARHGGPDLSHLRGHPHPPTVRQQRSRMTRSTNTTPIPATMKPKRSTPYTCDFDLHLTEHAVHSTWRSQEPDLVEIRAALTARRLSLSPFNMSEGEFESFWRRNDQAKDEEDVLANVIPMILGPSQFSHYCSRNTVFRGLEPLTDNTIAPPKPDIYFGAYPEQLTRRARNELAGQIIPSTAVDKPMAPNFFLDVKGPNGNPVAARRQARYDGAIGARAMHSLQNYGTQEPEYDGIPRTYSLTYHDGNLKLYAHHVTASMEGGSPEYHMTQVGGWDMTGDVDSFRRGVTAFRNARDLAKQQRDDLIRSANARVSQETGFLNDDDDAHKPHAR